MQTDQSTHSKVVGYILWIFGFTGSHRFYYGRPITGTIWFFTLGLVGIGWLVDAFLIPSMNRAAARRFTAGPTDYSVAWILLNFPWSVRHSPLLHGQVGHRAFVSFNGRLAGRWDSLRFLDAQFTGQ